LTMGAQIDGRTVVTVEGLAQGDALAPIQQAFVDCGAVQCGYCTPGLVVTAHAMLEKGEALDEEAVRRGLEGNICRCTGYMKIIQAVQTACQSKACGQEVAK
ncbi:MAG: (2Fe-2S)-binding protein, partial [Candidatus Sericytochromatia bacterium]